MSLADSSPSLKKLLLEMVRRSGRITFADYMALCLYHPELGYYLHGPERTGVRGDYFTSPDLHPIFARLIARQAAEMWERLGRPPRFTWVEMGPGRGFFARDFLAWVRASRPDVDAALDYAAIEPNRQQRARAAGRLAEAHLEERVRWLTGLEELEPITGCFFSNELVDAFPVAVVTRSEGRLKEIYVTADGDELRETLGPLSDARLAAAIARYAEQLEEGYRAEVSLQAAQWLREIAGKLSHGFVVTIDYGDLAEHLYTPARPRGTLMSYRGHRASEDFFEAPGEQDLTAHVNFSALMDTGKEAGLKCLGFTTQERFLMALGEDNQFADLYDPGQSEAEKLDARLKLKRLIFAGEGATGMGTVFKVLIQYRGGGDEEGPPLTGLKFQRKRAAGDGRAPF